MLNRIGVLAAVLLCAGCGHYIDAKSRNQMLQGAQPTYSSVAEIPFEKINLPSDLRFSIDEKSPIIEFGDATRSDKSYVRGFELPVRESEYQLTVRTYILRDGLFTPAMYFPIVDFLDEEKKPVPGAATGGWKSVFRIFSDEFAYDRDRWREFSQRITPNQRVRYILLHTNRYQVEAGGTVWIPPKNPPQLAAAVMVPIFIPSGGGGPVTLEGSVVGDLRIFLEEVPH